jgi:hypothetical protein
VVLIVVLARFQDNDIVNTLKVFQYINNDCSRGRVLDTDLANVGVVQRSINLVQDEEWGRLVAVYGEQQSQGSYSLLPSRQVVHGSEPLTRGHTVIVDPIQVRLLRVLWPKEGLGG